MSQSTEVPVRDVTGPVDFGVPNTLRPTWAWRLLVGSVTNFLRAVFRWKLHAQVIGEVPPADTAAVVVVNHTGQLEPFLVTHAVWSKTGHWVRPLAKSSLFKVPGLGFLARRSGGIPVYRDSEAGRGNAYGAAIACLDAGGTIYVAPEGTITHDGRLLPLRHGAARLALEAGVPMIVATSFGGQRAWSPIVGRPHFGAHYDVIIEALIPAEDDDAASLTGRVAATMLDRSAQLQAEYGQADPEAIWWPPYKEPAEPSKTARENLEQYREAMTEAVEHARERMARLAAERDLESRVRTARERGRAARENARARAQELGEQMRNRAEEMAELARNGELGEQMRHRAEELSHQARELAADMAEHLAEQLHVDESAEEDAPLEVVPDVAQDELA